MDAGEANKAPQVQSRNCGSEGHPSLPRQYSAAHPKVAFPAGSEGDHTGYQDRPAVPDSSAPVSSGGNGGVPCQPA